MVPGEPGWLREHQPRSQRPRDELDDLIDELFGSATDEKPGRFDAALAVVGLSLVAWAISLGGPSVALWIGLAAMVLGLALPAREVFRRIGSSPSGGLLGRLVGRNLPLDASQPATLALIGAYARLLQVSRMPGTADSKQAVLAGHAAVLEVARRLDGQPPDTPAKVRFVSMQTDALDALTRQVLRPHDRRPRQAAIRAQASALQVPSIPQQIPPERRWIRPRVQARSSNPGRPTNIPGRRP